MASAAEVRAWAREMGMEVPSRGKVPPVVQQEYDIAHTGIPGVSDPAVAVGEPPDDAFGGAVVYPAEEVFTGGAPERPPAEVKPVRPGRGAQAPAGRPGGGWRFGRGKAGKSEPAGKKPRRRISTEDLLSGAWRLAAKFAGPFPPLQRTLRIQAPVAGMLLEDTVRDTALDAFLQPLARLGGQGKVIGALAGPPLIVTMMMVHVQSRAAAGQEPNAVLLGFAQEALRSALMSWMEVAGPKFEIALRREQEFEEKYGQDVDALIQFLLSPPPGTQDEAVAEEEAIRRAQGYAPAA